MNNNLDLFHKSVLLFLVRLGELVDLDFVLLDFPHDLRRGEEVESLICIRTAAGLWGGYLFPWQRKSLVGVPLRVEAECVTVVYILVATRKTVRPCARVSEFGREEVLPVS